MKGINKDKLPALRAATALALILILGTIFNADGAFFKFGMHTDMLRDVSRFGILACGMTLVIITGGIDLSVGSILGLSAVCFSVFTIHLGWSAFAAFGACLVIGLACGAVSGVLIQRFKMQPFIATLAMMVFARGLAKVITGGQKISTAVKNADGSYSYKEAPQIFESLTGRVFGSDVFIVTIIMIVCAVICYILLRKLYWGRYIYAIGGNEEAARLSGIPVGKVKIMVYGLCALLSALAGICQAAQEMQGDPEAGNSYELKAIAIVVIGGTSLMGGRGGIMLTMIGTLIIGYLEKILSINAVPDAHRLMLTGIIIAGAVIFQNDRKNKKTKSKIWWVIGTATVAIIAVFTLYSGPDKGAKKKYVIGMSQCNLGEPWRAQMNNDIRLAAEKSGNIEVIFKDAQNDALKQKTQVEEFISAGVDLIIISPKEAAPLTPPVEHAMEKGIPVIVLDRQILGNKYTSYISADNYKIGKAAGEWVKKNFKAGSKIVELKGLMTSTPGQQRHNGFRDGIKGGNFDIIFEVDMKWLEPNARQEMASALSRFDKIDLVYGHNDPGAHGAWVAAKAARREKDIKFIGIDALSQEGQIYVKKGLFAASFEYPTGGSQAIEMALKVLNNETVPKKMVLPSRIFTPTGTELIK